ncbi:MAG: hypothetical protein MR008_04310 [Aerococcus sp.]|nr:hypothetical protein [Aerococcus sp.]
MRYNLPIKDESKDDIDNGESNKEEETDKGESDHAVLGTTAPGVDATDQVIADTDDKPLVTDEAYRPTQKAPETEATSEQMKSEGQTEEVRQNKESEKLPQTGLATAGLGLGVLLSTIGSAFTIKRKH